MATKSKLIKIGTEGNTYRFLLIVNMLTVFILSSIPGDNYPQVDIPNIDKTVHVLFYFPMGITGMLYALFSYKSTLAMLALLTVFAASDEVHQLFVRNRSCDLWDFIFDVVGISLGFIFCHCIKNIIIKRKNHGI